MADSSQDRHLPATERKIQKAREEGQVARSRDLGHFAAFFVAGVLMVVLAPELMRWMRDLVDSGLRFDARDLSAPRVMTERLATFGWKLSLAVLGVGLLLSAVAVGSGLAAGGWNFSWQALAPKLEKINPLTGVANLFSGQQLAQTLKACGLAVLIGGIGTIYLTKNLDRFAHTLALPLPAALAHVGSTVWAGLVLLLMALGAFALVDVPLQRFLLLRRLRMSVEEVKKEHKDVEGNGEIKAKMRTRMREMANRRMLAAVPKADLVVMNPTHFAVALRYDEASMGAPRVVAKGADLMAFRIRDAAKAAKVPVLEAPPLARALYAHAEVDREIPAALFSAVAQVLAWVYQLRASLAGRGPAPADLPELAVPPELDPKNPRAIGAPPEAETP